MQEAQSQYDRDFISKVKTDNERLNAQDKHKKDSLVSEYRTALKDQVTTQRQF